MENTIELIDKLAEDHSLSVSQYAFLLDNQTEHTAQYAAEKAVELRKAIYGTHIYIRGLIEISNYCHCNCLYCGIRKSNKTCERYRLTEEQILSCCDEGYAVGFRTFVLQGGEDDYFTDETVCKTVSIIKKKYPDCAVTLSLGEKKRSSYEKFFNSGADRYLLRHETADRRHYALLHPKNQTFENRMRCLNDLRSIGYQVGCGFMVGSPYQTNEILAEDLKFVETFRPDMCGIGPFVPHHATPFASFASGSVEKTTYLISLIRLIQPNILLPATTSLATADAFGREKGILAGANVVMPNLSPVSQRRKYELYDNKLYTNEESAQCRLHLERRLKAIGYDIVTAKGDINIISSTS